MNFYVHHNVVYEEDDKKIMQKADGVMSYTEVIISKDGSSEVKRHIFMDYQSYKDKDGDGRVDEVRTYSDIIHREYQQTRFERDKDLKQHPKIFEDADKDFREQMIRFKPYINR